MPHDVFISHSSKDKVYADAVCARLESEGIRCWIAPRDILPGMSWGSAIVEAIEAARLMVLVFSSHANSSPQIEREVERALNKEVTIVPLRIEPVVPGKNLEYFLGTPHWLDAVTPPFEQHLEYIAQTVKALLAHGKSGEPVDAPRPEAPSAPAPPPHKVRGRWLAAGAGVVAIVLLVASGWWLLPKGAVPRKLIGAWTATNFVGPDKIQFTLQVGPNGTYRYEILYKESGKVTVSGGQVYLRTADGLERPAGAVAPGSNPPCPANLIAAAPSAVWQIISRFSQSTKPLPQTNPFILVQAGKPGAPGNGQPAIWDWDAAFDRMAWQIRFVFDYDQGFAFTAQALDVGHIEARDGRWKSTSDVLERQREGAYSFVGDNSMVLTGSIRGVVVTTALGNTLWDRLGTSQAAPTMAVAAPTVAAQQAASPVTTAAPTVSPTMTPAPVSSPTATPQPPPIMVLDRRFIVSHDSPVYARPDSSSAVVGRVRRGRYVHITGLTGNWLRVRLYDGTVGFIPDQAVE